MNKNRKKFFTILSTGLISLNILTFTNSNVYSYTKNLIKLEQNNNHKKIAYITIDDGPSIYTNEIINILNKYNAKATFFMIDKNMKNYPNEVKNIIKNGNTAGFHSVSHDINKLYKSDVSAKKEFDINKETFYEITGKESNIVRLPYGSKPYTSEKSYEALVDASYKVWDWNIDTQDWKLSKDQILENVKKFSKNKDKLIILIHERKQTVQALDSMLNYLTKEGYELLPISQDQDPKNFWLNNLYK